MLVTINTDASFDVNSKFGGYAFWITCDTFREKKSMWFKETCLDSDDSEARSILNALHYTISKDIKISKIIVNTDSLNAIAILTNDKRHIDKYLNGKKKKRRKHWSSLRRVLNDLRKVAEAKGGNMNIEFRHVKAHSEVKDARSFVNEWCDLEAKKMMNKRRMKGSFYL
jgi:ribonuclease HI